MNPAYDDEHTATDALADRLARKGMSAPAIMDSIGRAIPIEQIRGLVEKHRPPPMASKAVPQPRAVDAIAHYRIIEPISVLMRRTSVAMLTARVCEKYGLDKTAILGDGRTRAVVYPRQELMYRATVETTLSLAHIGRLLRRHHTSVIFGVRAHCRREGLPLPRGMKAKESSE